MLMHQNPIAIATRRDKRRFLPAQACGSLMS
jgi:hypothetical protein